MSEKISVEFKDVQITLLLPLWGRVIETQKSKPLLIDKAAVEIISKIEYDFEKVAQSIQDIMRFEWIARSIHIDKTIREFLVKYPNATIVNVGCGLDTTFERVDNGKLFWYDLDLPDVIEFRRKFIKESERRKFIPCSFLSDNWFSEITVRENVLFVAAGVLYYFEENQIKEIFNKISSSFPESEFVFDAASPFGIQRANEKLIQRIGLDEKSFLKWGIQSAKEILEWNRNIKVIKECPMFREIMEGFSFRNKIVARISDYYKIMYMVHLKFLKT